MSLLKRLQRTLGDATAPPTVAPTPTPSLAPALERLGSALARHLHVHAARDEHDGEHMALMAHHVAFADALPAARALPSRLGDAWSISTHLPADSRHGRLALGDALTPDFAALARAIGDSRLEGFSAADAVFLDIETTGLEHGSGNVAFLIAIGWFEGQTFVLEQLLLKEPSDEPAVLGRLWQWLEARPYLVSFNGKSFDLSILQNRLIMHRFSSPEHVALKLRPHLDLLHVARAFFKGLWSDTRLQTLEVHALGFERDGDMPGSMAPSCYFKWLREQNAGPLAAIARHNRDDVLSMVVMTALLGRFAMPMDCAERPVGVTRNLAERFLNKRSPADALALCDVLSLVDADAAILELGLLAARRAGDLPRLRFYAERLLATDPAHAPARRALARRVPYDAHCQGSGSTLS